MTKKQKSFALIPIICTFLFCAIMGVVGLLPTKTVSAEYSSPIPAGYYVQSEYDVLDVTAKDLGATNSALSQELGNARVARFKYTNKVGGTWSLDIGMFTTTNAYGTNSNEGCFYITIPNSNTKNISLSIVSAKQSAHNTQTFDCPDFINLNTVGESHNVEVGALDVTDGTDTVAGKNGVLIYMDIDGVRVVEYHYTQYPTLPFGGDNLWIVENPTSTRGIDITAYDLSATSLTDKTNVSFSEESYDCTEAPATPKPVVTAIIEKNGSSYGQVVEPKYYDVAYTNNDKAGTATATVTFKGKYSGSTTGTFTTTVEKSPFEDYTSVIPEGFNIEDDYTVAELSSHSYTSAGDTSMVKYALSGAKAMRFSVWYGTAVSYQEGKMQFSIFANNYYSTDGNAGMAVFTVQKNSTANSGAGMSITIYQTNNNTKKAEVTFTQPEWLDLTTKAQYKTEVGGIDVLDGSGNYAGKYFYLDMNGVRIMEYFYSNSDLKFTNDNFNFWAACSNASLTGYLMNESEAISLDGKASVTFSQASYDVTNAPATPKPVVTAIIEKNGSSYGQVVEPKYYDVAYTNNDKAGTATATVTFKGKYSGSTTGTFTTTVEKSPFEDYTSVIPEGFNIEDDYTVAELSSHSYTSAGDTSMVKYALSGAKAMRFSVWYGTAVSYQEGKMQFSIFANNYYSTDGNAGMAVFTVQKNSTANSGAGMSITIYQTNHNTTKATKSFAQPEWMDFTTKAQFKIEIGGLDVLDYKGDYVGKYFYMDVNGVRVIEYFYSNSDLKFTNDNCSIWMASSNASITSNALTTAIDLTEKTKVELTGATSGSEVTAKANVYAALTNAGETYVQIVEPKYYEIAFANNDNVGTATATITFNGKYSGTATCEFDIVAINLTSNSSVVQTIYAKKGASVTLGAIQVSGKVFVGYDVEGALKSSVTVEATEEKTVQVVAIDFVTEALASVKLEGTMGMRFISNILASDKALLENYGTVTYGTKITSPTKSGYLNVPVNVWSSVGAGERDSFTAVLKGFTESDYATTFKATAYVTITTADETITVYASVDEDFSRSIAEVAALTLENAGVLATDPEFDENIHVTEYNGKYYEYSERAVNYLATAASYYVAE